MKWVLISSRTNAIQEYHLVDNDSCKLILKYNPRQHSARISCGTHQRLFFIESAGQLNAKKVFRNEYGMEIGSLSFDKWSNKIGTVMIDENKYNYQFHNNPLAEIILYKNDKTHPLVSCGLKTDDHNTTIAFENNTNGIDNSCLLLGLCWYLFLPVAKENTSSYAL